MVEIPVEKWAGKVRTVKLGGNGKREVVVGGETTLPFLHFEGSIPNRPRVGVEVHDRPPSDWAAPLAAAWGEVWDDPARWAKRAVEVGADLIALHLKSAHPEAENTGAEEAKRVVDKVLAAVDIPLLILGPGMPDKDNEVLVAASDAAQGQRVALGLCEEKNYRTIAATCIANNQVAIARTPIEINLCKQLNVLISDVGLSSDSIIVDPTTGALGYGLEYTYSVMERVRLAGLRGDGMLAMPMLNTVGEEAWRQKEAKFSEGLPPTWGDQETRALVWEELTAHTLLMAGSDIAVLRHPKTIELIQSFIDRLMKG